MSNRSGFVNRVFLRLFFLYCFLPYKVVQPFTEGIDPSYQFAINTAKTQDYVFGKDIAFTYGPLGYLIYGMRFPENPWLAVLFKLVIGLLFVLFFLKCFEASQSLYVKMFLAMTAFFCGRFIYFDLSLPWFILIVGTLLFWLRKPDFILASFLAVACALDLFMKLSSGFVSEFLFLITAAAVFVKHRELRKKLALLLSFQLILILFLVKTLNIDLINYVANSLEFIRFYNDSMMRPLDEKSVVPLNAIVIVFCLVYISATMNEEKVGWLKTATSAFVILAVSYVLFKRGFVFADGAHLIGFFCAAAMLLCALLFIGFKMGNNSEGQNMAALLGLFMAITAVFNIGEMPFYSRPLRDLYMSEPRRPRILPERIRSLVGKARVDLFPHESSLLGHSNIVYSPRFSPQSYATYSSKLDSMNVEHFVGKRAADFVFYSNGSIEERYPFCEDTQTKLCIRKAYSIIDSFDIPRVWQPDLNDKYYVLRKDTEVVRTRPVKTNFGQADLNREIFIPDSKGPVVMKCHVNYSFYSRLRRFLYQPVRLKIRMRFADGSETLNWVPLPLLENGILVDSKYLSTDDTRQFFSRDHNAGIRCVSITLIGLEKWYKQTVRYSIEEYL